MSIETIEVAGAEALQHLMALRSDYATSGKYPFLIGPKEELDRLNEHATFFGDSLDGIVGAAEPLIWESFLRERKQELAEYGFDEIEILGDWEGNQPDKGAISAHKKLPSGKFHPQVYIGLASIAAPWQIPAAVNYGGWNDCPEAEVQCAAMKRWGEIYGAEIASMSGDVIECIVSRPPTTQVAAMQLAWEQYWYCGDIVDQGTETILRLAATLINSDYWFFWWD